MTAGQYLVGLLCFVTVFGSSLLAAGFILRRLGGLAGVERALAFGVLSTGVLIGVHLVPGAVGLLDRWVVAVTSLVAAAAAYLAARGARGASAGAAEPRTEAPATTAIDRAVWALAAAGGAAFVIAALLDVRLELSQPATTVDTTTFHLPQVASWIRTESLWGIHQFVPLQAHANYPQNGDVIHLATVLPWRNDAFARPIGWVYVLLAAAAVSGLSRRLGAPASFAALLGVVFASTPAVILTATGGTLTDPILIAMFGCGLVFLARHARTGSTPDLVLAGLGLGLAFGTKWYGVSSVIAVVACWAVFRLVTRAQPLAVVVRQTAAVSGLVALTGGFWLLRNWVGSGNPVFPVKVEVLGLTIFDAPPDTVRETLGFNLLHYAGDLDILRGPVADGLWGAWSAPGFLAVAGLVCAAVVVLRRQRTENLPLARLMAVAAALLFAVYVITPYTALGFDGEPIGVEFNARYALPALLVAAALLGWLAGRLTKLQLPLAVAGVLVSAVGIREGFEPSAAEAAAMALAALVAGGCVLAPVAWRRPLPRPAPAVAAAMVGLALAAAAAVGYNRQRVFNENRYTAGDRVLEFVAESAPAGHRIGIDGEWTVTRAAPVLPAFGPRFENAVSYIGSLDSELLTPYGDRRSWSAEVAAEGYDLILVGRLRPRRARLIRDWSRRAGYRMVARSPGLLLMGRREPG